MTDDLADIPRPRRSKPTRRRALKDEAQRLEELDAQNLTLYGLSTIHGAKVTDHQLISSTRKFFRGLAKRNRTSQPMKKQRCL